MTSNRGTRTIQTNERRGTVLIIVVVLLLTSLMISGAIVQVLLADARRLESSQRAMQAARLAESGLRRGYARVLSDSEYASETWSPALPEGEGTVAITVIRKSGQTIIRSVATFPADSASPARARRTLRVNEDSSKPQDQPES